VAAPVKPPTIVAPLPELPPSRHLAARTALGLIFTRVGERFVSRGQHFLPLKSGGQIIINTQSFPIIEMRNGQRIVLDLDRRLQDKMVDLIRLTLSSYTIFRPNPHDQLSGMLLRLFKLGQYYQVQAKGEPLIVRREVTIKIQADMIVWPTQRDHMTGRAVVITLPSSLSQGTAPEIAQYLAGKGITVIDFHPQGNLIGPEPRRETTSPDLDIRSINPDDFKSYFLAVLELLGQKYEVDLSIPLLENKTPGQEFTFNVQAPIYFTRNGVNFVLALDGLSSDMQQLLESHKFKVISRQSAEGAQALTQRLLNAMGIITQPGLNITASARPADRNIEITFPGLLFWAGGRQTLLTPTQVPQDLAPLLARPNLQVVQYRITNPT
ncbi:MAG: hypothetical protein V1742_10905, partial [Pseudomonadota bacterium]